MLSLLFKLGGSGFLRENGVLVFALYYVLGRLALWGIDLNRVLDPRFRSNPGVPPKDRLEHRREAESKDPR